MCDPTSLAKLDRLTSALYGPTTAGSLSRRLTHFSPNRLELDCLASAAAATTAGPSPHMAELFACPTWTTNVSRLALDPAYHLEWLINSAQAMVVMLQRVDHIWLKCGQDGLIHATTYDSACPLPPVETRRSFDHRLSLPLPASDSSVSKGRHDTIRLTHYPPTTALTSYVSSTGAGDSLVGGIVAGIALGFDHDRMAKVGLNAARASLASSRAVGELDSVV